MYAHYSMTIIPLTNLIHDHGNGNKAAKESTPFFLNKQPFDDFPFYNDGWMD